LYAANFDDSSLYYVPVLSFLFTIWSVLFNSGRTTQAIINASGKWKITNFTSIVQGFILIFLVSVLGKLFDFEGILLGMIISTFFKTIYLIYLTKIKIFPFNLFRTYKRLILIFIVIAVSFLPFVYISFDTVNSYLSWIFVSAFIVLWSSFISFIIYFLFDRSTLLNTINVYIFPIILLLKEKFIKK
jgi:hypothetical protein